MKGDSSTNILYRKTAKPVNIERKIKYVRYLLSEQKTLPAFAGSVVVLLILSVVDGFEQRLDVVVGSGGV